MTFRLTVPKSDFDEAKAQARANDAEPESHWPEGTDIVMQFRSAEKMGRTADALAVRNIDFDIETF